jgi:fumarate reductase subunit D
MSQGHPLLKFEPLIWFLFGQGILIGSMLMTGWLLVVGILNPLGIAPPEALAYERAHMLASHPIGRLVLLGILVLPVWKGAHHVRHFFIDRGYADHDSLIGGVCYLVASLLSVTALVAVVRL